MTSSLSTEPRVGVARPAIIAGVTALVLIAYTVPFLGLLVSLALPFAVHAARRHLWPDAPARSSLTWSVAAWAGLWLPAVAFMATGSLLADGTEVSTGWLVLPLCAPVDLLAVVVPALAAAATCFAGLLASVATRRGWLFLAAAWLAPWVHQLAFSQLGSEYLC